MHHLEDDKASRSIWSNNQLSDVVLDDVTVGFGLEVLKRYLLLKVYPIPELANSRVLLGIFCRPRADVEGTFLEEQFDLRP